MSLNNIILSIIIILLGESKFLNCGDQNPPEKLTAISLIKKTPIVNWDKSVTTFEIYYTVYYYKDLAMYKINYEFDSLYNHDTVLQEMRYLLFVSHKDSTYGYKYFNKPNPPININQRVKKDSILITNKFESNIYDTLIHLKPDSVYNNKNQIIKVYKNPPSPNPAPMVEKFDLYFYYTKDLKDVSETFSRKMDNVKGMKLNKVLVKVSGGFYKEYNITFTPRELVQEMKEITIENKDEIMTYFRKYQQQEL
ncbi:MAG TPA: hypothetical protein VFH08_02615 [Chitinophagaceae bacterium]|nr:hypothetical protein [Chitinophagaceae bacterium]